MRNGRRFGAPPKPYEVAETPTGKINTTDPDSRLMKAAGNAYLQAYNAQAATNERQIVVAAEISVDGPDFGHLEPMVEATVRELDTAGISEAPELVVADAGYWHHEQMDELAGDGIQVLIPPDFGKRKGTRPGWQGGRYAWMRRVLATELGERLYRKRSQTVEPMFGHTKHNRGMDRLHRRGRSAVRTERRLITATHNLMKQPPRRGHKGPAIFSSGQFRADAARPRASATASRESPSPGRPSPPIVRRPWQSASIRARQPIGGTA
jgi:Transposase DDE domain